jgi:hypothetical protein
MLSEIFLRLESIRRAEMELPQSSTNSRFVPVVLPKS